MTQSNTTENVEKQESKSYRPLICSTFARSIQEWGENSTLHGVSAVFSRKSGIFRRLFWLSVIGASIYALQYGYTWQINRYLKYRTVTKDTIRHEDYLPFPAITICSTCLIRNDTFENETERQLLVDIYSMTNASVLLDKYGPDYISEYKLSEMYVKHAFTSKEMFYSCMWSRYSNCTKHIQGRLFSRGFCYTINGDGNKSMEASAVGSGNSLYMVLFTNQDNYYIAEYTSAGFRILIHDHHQEPDMTMSTYLSPGFSYYIGLSRHENKLMKSPVKALGDSECLDTSSPTFTNPLRHFHNYSYYACEMECLTNFVYNICGCVNPIRQNMMKECDPIESVSCSFPAAEKFSRNSAAIIRRCGCLIPCEYTEFRSKVSFSYFPNANHLKLHADTLTGRMQDLDYVRANYLSLNIFYESKVVSTREQILEFPQLDLIASLSGYLGLAIGASVLTFIEFLELIYIVFSKLFSRH